MPRVVPKPPPKGTRHPGAGRAKGTPNKISVEARVLVSELINNPNYQRKLREDFERRRVHPTIESLIWQYHSGKPHQPVDVTLRGSVDVLARIEDERRVFASLDLATMERVAAESQALTDRVLELSRSRMLPAGESRGENETEPQAADEISENIEQKGSGSDNGYYDEFEAGPSEVAGEDSVTPEDAES